MNPKLRNPQRWSELFCPTHKVSMRHSKRKIQETLETLLMLVECLETKHAKRAYAQRFWLLIALFEFLTGPVLGPPCGGNWPQTSRGHHMYVSARRLQNRAEMFGQNVSGGCANLFFWGSLSLSIFLSISLFFLSLYLSISLYLSLFFCFSFGRCFCCMFPRSFFFFVLSLSFSLSFYIYI